VQSSGSAALNIVPRGRLLGYGPMAFRSAIQIAPAKGLTQPYDGLLCRGCAAIREPAPGPLPSDTSGQGFEEVARRPSRLTFEVCTKKDTLSRGICGGKGSIESPRYRFTVATGVGRTPTEGPVIPSPLSITDCSGSIQNAQIAAPINSRPADTPNGATQEPLDTR
jgi:hypothetical protein